MHKVGVLQDLSPDKPLRATVADRKILIFLVDGAPVATAARCPHAAGPLHQGEICNGILTCPWHGWSFDIATGSCEEDPDLKLEVYPVRVDGDAIFVSL